MRHARIKLTGGLSPAYYHCLSRAVNRDFLFGDVEKECFVALMREYEAFCGVRVVTYCVMSNHFHILVEVPPRPALALTAEELIERLKGLSGSAVSAAQAKQMIGRLRAAGAVDGERDYLESFFRRMWDVSEFMKLLKQRFSSWYNRSRNRKGTLWEERFKSVLVEGAGESVVTVASYIDLNSVRAGLVSEPHEYRWCGYAEAMAGIDRAMAGLERIAVALKGAGEATTNVLELYRCRLFAQGEQREGQGENGGPLRRGFDRAKVLAIIENRGIVSTGEYLRCRVRYFSDGVVLGSQGFVDAVFQAFRSRFGRRPRVGARKMSGMMAPELFTLRGWRHGVFG